MSLEKTQSEQINRCKNCGRRTLSPIIEGVPNATAFATTMEVAQIEGSHNGYAGLYLAIFGPLIAGLSGIIATADSKFEAEGSR